MSVLRNKINTKKLFRAHLVTDAAIPDEDSAVLDSKTGELIINDTIKAELDAIGDDRTEIYNDPALFTQNKFFIKFIEDLREDMEHLHAYVKDSFGMTSSDARRAVSSSLTSTSTSNAATSKAVKDVNDRIDTILAGANVSYDTLKEISDQGGAAIAGLATKLNKSGGTMTGSLVLEATTPTLQFNGTSDASVDMAVKADPESLVFYEPEDGDKVHFKIIDDGGVDAPLGYKVEGTVVIGSDAMIDANRIKNVPSSWTALRTLSNSITSTSTTVGASSKAVSTLNTKINDLSYSTASTLTNVTFNNGSLYFTVSGTEYEVKLIKLA